MVAPWTERSVEERAAKREAVNMIVSVDIEV
jgi:hypothetical protein